MATLLILNELQEVQRQLSDVQNSMNRTDNNVIKLTDGIQKESDERKRFVDEMHKNIDEMHKNIDEMHKNMDVVHKNVDKVALLQRISGETVRRSANSINVIVRLLAGLFKLNYNELSDLLLQSDGLVTNVKPNSDVIHEQILLNDSPKAKLKLLTAELIQFLESITSDANTIDPMNASTNSQTTNTIDPIPSTSSQTMDTIDPIPSTSSQTMDTIDPIPSTSSQTAKIVDPANILSSSQTATTNISPIPSTVVTGRNKITQTVLPKHSNIDTEENRKEEAELRRKYNNKYRYLNVNEELSSTENDGDVNGFKENKPRSNGDQVLNDINDAGIVVEPNQNRNMENKVLYTPFIFLNKCDAMVNSRPGEMQHFERKGSFKKYKNRYEKVELLDERVYRQPNNVTRSKKVESSKNRRYSGFY